MSQYGLLIKDASGRVIIDPNTFTVRMIENVWLPGGTYTQAVRLSSPRARRGMFAVGTPLGEVPIAGALRIGYNDDLGKRMAPYVPRMPAVTVENGVLICSPPSAYTDFTGNIMYTIMAYV